MEFIPRKFKNIETNDIINFEELVKSSNISVILGEPASGKTYQLKTYKENNDKSELFLLKMLSKYKKKDIKGYDILLLDSIDEALLKIKDDDELILDLVRFIEKHKKKKIIITCRYLEWKENFEEKLKEIDNELKVYDIQELSKEDINSLLDNDDIGVFWNFIEKNHLQLLLKNIMIVKYLTDNFKEYNQKENINYTDIYKKIIEQSITSKGKNRKHKYDKRKIKELFPISASLATYMMLNRKDTILGENIDDIENFVDELYQVKNKYIKDNDLKKVLDTALFEKKGDEFTFFHKSIQEYLTAYFIDYKKLDFKTIKKIFSHDLKFYEEFEEAIIYLTNMQPYLFNDFVDFDPFIFRRHPSLSKEQQEKLLLSILKRLQNNEAFAWDKKAFFYNTSLVKFNDIDVYSIIKDKNIEKSQNDILLQYIMRLFAENYAQEFENYIFEILSQNLHDKIKCSKLIGYSYNIDYRYNLTLFNFMKKNQLFFIEDNTSIYNAGIGADRNINSYIIEKIFLVLYGFKFQHNNYNEIIARDNKDYDVEKVVNLIPFIKYESFVEITSSLISLEDMEVWFKHILKTYTYEFGLGSNYHDNIGWILYKILGYFILPKELLLDIIVFVQKNQVSIQPPSFQKYTKLPTSLLFYPIQNDFWEIYFSDDVQSFLEVNRFISFYHIKKIDIEEMQKKYPFEDNFFKTFQLLEYLNSKYDNDEEFLVLEEEQLEKVVSKLKYMEQNEELVEAIFTLFRFNYSKELEDLVFQILKKYTNDIEKCRKYIEKTLVSSYAYNFKLFNFMKKYELFMVEKYEIVSFDAKNKIENWLFNGLYGLWFKNKKPRLEKNDYKEEDIVCLFEYISYYHFFDISEYIDIEDIEKWFYYFYKHYNSRLLENNSDYKDSIGWIAYKLLIDNKLQSIPLEEIMKFFQDTNLHISFTPSKNGLSSDLKNTSPKPLFYTIENEFWNIYFSDKIKSFEEIKNFISLYNIDKKDLKEAIEKYPIEENIEKYYGLGIQYNFIDLLMDNEKYKEYVEHKQEEKESMDDYYEKKYLNEIIRLEKEKQYHIYIQNVNEENFYDIFYSALAQENNDFIKTDKKLRDDLKDKYDIFISEVVKGYILLEKEYIDKCYPDNQWIYNYLFNILSTQEEINNTLVTDENYRKLFWYIVLGCISTRNDVLFNVIEEKFDLFLQSIKEFIEVIVERKNPHCFNETMNYNGPNRIDAFCHKIIDILNKISFDKESDIWIKFISYVKEKKEINTKYEKFFQKIDEIKNESYSINNSLQMIQKNNEESFTHFTFVFREDINLALEYFYKYIYDSIHYKQVENNTKLDDFYLTSLNDDLFNKNPVFYNFSQDINLTDEEKKLEDKEFLEEKLKEFYKDKNTSYNAVKIILFDKLLKQFGWDDYKNLDEVYIEKILIDYYKLFNEKKIPLAKDYSDFNGQHFPTQGQSPSVRLTLNLWGLLQNDKKYKKLLKKLKKSTNKNISNSAGHCLNKINTKEISNKEINFENLLEEYSDSNKPLIITEGKTDWKHLKKALERFKKDGEYQNLDIEFLEYDEKDVLMSDSELVVHVRTYSNTPQSKKHIMIFDRDATDKKDIKRIFNPNKQFTNHGNKVYSLFIPPVGRLDKICIEFYYKQEEVQEAWFEGKRLFYGNEFDSKTQKSIQGKYKTDKPCPQDLDILDGDNKKKVYKIDDEEKKENNIALSKNKFSENILKDIDGFNNFNIENFRLIFDVIEGIVND